MREQAKRIALLRINCYEGDIEHNDLHFCEQQEVIDFLKKREEGEWPEAIVSAPGSDVPCYDELVGYLQGLNRQIPLFIYDEKIEYGKKILARELGVADYFGKCDNLEALYHQAELHILARRSQAQTHEEPVLRKKQIAKRVFDIAIALTLLLLLLPLFLLVALAIRLESKGKVFYFQPRVGQGYKTFKFFKFRSMRVNADKMVAQLQNVNPYHESKEIVLPESESEEQIMLLGDEGQVSESEYLLQKSLDDEKAFFKVHNDPRITKVGHFIRKTSIDELPQLVNVLIGDMSIVGNRPLPLYEAEKLTSDQWATRFLAPAGITGLWQVTERGKKNVSADSRKQLDIEYAMKSNFWTDLWILFKTPLAAIQQENC